jgi:hypothetical protein
MRRLVVCLTAIGLVVSSNLLACGDKFVVFGQGVRFQRAYAAAHPANILVYLKAGSKWSTPENRERLLTVLRMVGHRPQGVSTLEELHAAVATAKYDVVLTELSTVGSAMETLGKASVPPTVIPLVFQPSRQELKEIERTNSCTVAVSRRTHELLSVINDVMDRRTKGVTDGCERKRA